MRGRGRGPRGVARCGALVRLQPRARPTPRTRRCARLTRFRVTWFRGPGSRSRFGFEVRCSGFSVKRSRSQPSTHRVRLEHRTREPGTPNLNVNAEQEPGPGTRTHGTRWGPATIHAVPGYLVPGSRFSFTVRVRGSLFGVRRSAFARHSHPTRTVCALRNIEHANLEPRTLNVNAEQEPGPRNRDHGTPSGPGRVNRSPLENICTVKV